MHNRSEGVFFSLGAYKRIGPTAIAWVVPHLFLLVVAVVWYVACECSPEVTALAVQCVACALAIFLTIYRERIRPSTLVLLAATTALGVLALELCANDKFYAMGKRVWLLEFVIVVTLICGLWLLTGRRGIAPALVLAELTFVGVAQHYVLEFRGTAILPSDLFALGTAIEVSNGYSYDLSSGMLYGFSALSLGIACCSLMQPTEPAESNISHLCSVTLSPSRQRGSLDFSRSLFATKRLREVAGGAALLVLLALLLTVPSYAEVFDVQMDYWWSGDYYRRQGFLPSFIRCWQDLDVTAPEGYSGDVARTTQATLAKAYLDKPGTQERRSASTA